MCNVFKKYGKIIFLFMIVFIGSFFSIEKVEAAKSATFNYNISNRNRYTVSCGGDLYLSGDFTSDKADIVFSCGGTQKLDLRGHKLNAMDRILIEGNTYVYIYDSVGGGVVTNEAGGESTSDAGLYEVMAGSTLTIEGGTHRNSRTIGPVVKLFPTRNTDYGTHFNMRGGRIERKYSDLSTISKSVQDSKRAPIPIISSAGRYSRYVDINLVGGTVYDELTNGITAGGFNSTEKADSDYFTVYPAFTTNTKYLFENYIVSCSSGAVICDPNEFYIFYYDGTTRLKYDTYEYGEGKSISYSPTKEGYKLEGWYTNYNLTNKKNKY